MTPATPRHFAGMPVFQSIIVDGAYGRVQDPAFDTGAYERELIVMLKDLAAHEVGEIVIANLRRAVTVAPDWSRDGYRPRGNALSRRDGRAFGSPTSPGDPTAVMGSGRPSRYLVLFSPRSRDPRFQTTGAASAPDEILLHELWHALEGGLGAVSHLNPRSPSGFASWTEFNACLVTNIYCSSRQRPLRGPVYGPDPNGAGNLRLLEMHDPDGFHARNRESVEDFCRKFEPIARRLAAVRARFNPPRQFLAEQVEAG